MRSLSGVSTPTGLSGPVVVGAGLLLLALAPLIRGGNRHVALVLLEWTALILLLALLLRTPSDSLRRPWAVESQVRWSVAGVAILALAPVWVALTQLTPLPAHAWEALAGRAVYGEALAVAQADQTGSRAPSLTPEMTVLSVLAGLPLSAGLLLGFLGSVRQIGMLVHGLIAVSVLQAILGLLQMGPFPALFFGAPDGGRAMGTFANPNHFASFITMTLPLVVLGLRQAIALSRNRTPSDRIRSPAGMVWGITLFLMLSAVLASGSRGGVLTALVVVSLATLALPVGRRHRQVRRWGLASVAGLLGLVALTVGVDALMARFQGDRTGYLAGDRWQMITGAWHAAIVFWPYGSGLGSFAAVFPAFHPAGVRGFVEHAHNDYVQFLMECGLLAVVLAIVALALIVRQMVRLGWRFSLSPAALLQAGAGLGLLAVLLHSWVDFNLRIPANAILASFLLGIFLRPLDATGPEPHHEATSS